MKSQSGWRWKFALLQALLVVVAGIGSAGLAQGTGAVSTTTVQGTVYRADGTPAQGTMLVSWPAFVTAANQAVAAGSETITVGADGFASLSLAPNAGASPAGSYYTVVYHLSDGTVSREFWTIPASASATIASVRAQLEPSIVAVQSVTKSYVDSAIANIAPTAGSYLALAGGSMQGPLTLPADPASASQATTKHYVDTQVATAVPLAGGTVTGTLQVANSVEKLPRVDVRNGDFAGGADPTGVRDSTAALQAAIAFATASSPSGEENYPTVYLPAGHYMVNGTLRIPYMMHLSGDAKATTILQETNPTASLLVVWGGVGCSLYSCYGTIENLTLEGTGKATAGALLEMNFGFMTLRDLHFYNHGGRGLQMNGPTERISTYDLSFYRIRWPLILGGDSNEDYFFNTHVIEAGQTADAGSGAGYVGNWCYNVNCTNGQYEAQGTTANPTVILPDPHGAIYIDKSVNVNFIGGSVKSSFMLSGVKNWAGTVVRFQNFYHENIYGGNGFALATNRAYMVGGPGEQTWLTGSLSGNGTSVSVHDGSWMPQAFGAAADGTANDGNYYPYVIMPQDYNRASSAPSAYVSGVNQNQFEMVNAEGFTPDGVMHLQPNGRNNGGSTAPAGTVWPAGSVVEEYLGANASLELDGIHINQVQGPQTAGGWTAGCNATNVYACGEVMVGYPPDTQAPTANPATNKVGFYTALGDAYDPIFGATGYLRMRHMDMYSNPSNPSQGMVIAEHRAVVSIDGPIDPEYVESTVATAGTSAGTQVSIAAATGGSALFAPKYATGATATVNLSMADGEVLWDTARGAYHKHTSLFQPYQQYGFYMNGLQYQNLYCIFDTPSADGGHVQNRWCHGGGPGNTGGSGAGVGGGVEYDSWTNNNGWVPMFKVAGQNGTGSLQASVPANFASSVAVSGAASVAGTLNVGAALTATGGATVAGGLTASGPAQMTGTLNVSAKLTAAGGATVSGGTLTAANGASVVGGLTASGPAQVTGTLSVSAALTAAGGATVSGGTLTAANGASVSGGLTASGGATVAGGLVASGGATVSGGPLNAAGGLTAAQVNGTITVDGTTYSSLNAAWTAGVAAATSSGKNQTIWLGPGSFPVTSTLTEPTNGACVSVIGSAGSTVGASIGTTATTLTVPSSLGGDVFFLGNANRAEGCTFKDLNVLAGANATHGFEFQWARGMLLDTITVNDTTGEGVLLGESSTASGHQMNSLLRNVTVSYSSGAFSPASRPAYGLHLQKTAIDSVMHTILVRNALTAAVWNEGTGNIGYGIHGFGYPYTCTTAPCSNTASSGSAANASYATNYVVYDTGGAGTVWTDTYADSPAISAFYIAANGVEIHGGHVQWPELASFPSANFATVTAAVTNGLEIADIGCLGMSGSVNWINYQAASGVPPTFASVHHLTGCGNYYQALEPATTTGFSGGGASNNAPGNGAVAAVWAAPKAGAATYSAYSAQEYTGYQGDLFDGHIAGQMPFFNITYQGTIKSQGGLALSTVVNTAATLTLTTANKNVIANAASGAQTLTLPSCFTAMPDKAAPTGLELTVIKSDASANAVTLTTVSGQTINYGGATAATLVVSAAAKRSLVCGPDNNWYAY